MSRFDFDWSKLGTDEGGLPVHLPMGMTATGQGPENDDVAHHYECWCQDPDCPLTSALLLAWKAGIRAGRPPA
jgi:hypothetical protein